MDEDLVRRLRNASVFYNRLSERLPNGSVTGELLDEAAELLDEAADAIEKLSRKTRELPRWISVTEKPPFKVGDDGYNGYLVYANGYYAVADYTTDKVDNVPYFHVDGEYEPNVTHYMPLPKPPEEDEE